MKKIFNLGLLTIIAFLGFSVTTLKADIKQEFTKAIKKEFSITQDGTVDIHNKYGKINLTTWEKNRVKVAVTITVNARSESKAQEMFERIDIKFDNGSDFVFAKTILADDQGTWDWIKNAVMSDFTIDYEVFMPASCKLNLSNRYGDTYITSLDNDVNLDIAYGNLKIKSVGKALKLELSYGKGRVGQVKDMNAEVAYGTLILEAARTVNLESKYAKVEIENAESLFSTSKYDTYTLGNIGKFVNEGKYDNIEIEQVNDLKINSKYVDILIEEITNLADFDLKYGAIEIEDLNNSFREIIINAAYTECDISVEDGTEYRVDANTKYADIKVPSSMNITVDEEDNSKHRLQSYQGDKATPRVIKVNLSYGGFKVKD